MRGVVNGLMYILSTGCQWRYLPKEFPPHSTVYNYFVWWQCDRVLDRIHHALYVECRKTAEREASPTAAIIDSQSVKSAEKDAMGRAARTMPPSSLQRINGAPHWVGPTGNRSSLTNSGRRQPSCDGTSRMNREVHVRNL
jgi:transposase